MFFLLSNCTHYFKTLLQTLMTILFSPIHRHIMRCSTACIDISMNDFKIVDIEVIKCFQLFTTVSPINNQLYTSLYSLKIWVRIKCQDRCAPMKWENRRNGAGTERSEPETATDDTETGNRDLGTNCLLLHHYHYNSLIFICLFYKYNYLSTASTYFTVHYNNMRRNTVNAFIFSNTVRG